MKKITFVLAVLLASNGAMFAQLNSAKGLQKTRDNAAFNYPKAPSFEKAEGDVIYQDNFSSASTWTFTDNSTPLMNTSSYGINIGGPTGDFSAPQGSIVSTTAANGFGLIDSDAAYGAEGAQDLKLAFNTVMDFTAHPNVSISFETYHRMFRDSVFLEFSVNGAPFVNRQIRLDAELGSGDASVNPKKVSINVSSIVGGQANVLVRFHYEGEWDYAWMIDDMKFFETFSNEIVTDAVFMTTDFIDSYGEDYYKIPASQTSFPGIEFGANITNQGSVAQSNVNLGASLNAAPVVSGTSPIASLAVVAKDSVVLDVPISLVSGLNTFVVSTSQTAVDQVPANNTKTIEVTLGGTEFARHNGVLTKFLNFTDANTGYRVSNIYVPSNDMILKSASVRVNGAATNVGQEVYIRIEEFDGTAYNILSEQSDFITTANNNNYVSINFLGDNITLTGGTIYRVWAGNYASTTPVYFGAAQKTAPQISFLQFEGGANANTIFYTDDAPMISLFETTAGIEENNFISSVSMYPNPTTSSTSVKFVANQISEANVEVSDVTGKVVSNSVINTVVGSNSIEINTVEFAAGMYTVSIVSNGSKTTRQLVVE
jgi:hypothetical protein